MTAEMPTGLSPNSTLYVRLAELGLPPRVAETIDTLYRPVADWVSHARKSVDGPLFIGVNGAQGSGKTTFCALLEPVLEEYCGLKAACVSIDDVYHLHATRKAMGNTIHPLCQIRGVPGTHDIPLAHALFDQFMVASEGDTIPIPRFDKARDERRPQAEWDSVTGPVDVVFFEGWCVGCPPIPPWREPINDREAREDPQGTWATWSARCLEDELRPLLNRLDAQIFIRVPSMETVRESRWLQEKKLWARHEEKNSQGAALKGLMTQDEVRDYVALFERYTEHMLEHMPLTADVFISRDQDFNYTLERIPGRD